MSLSLPVPPKPWLKSDDFVNPKTLSVSKAPERQKVDNPQYGDKEGMTNVYYFADKDGNQFEFKTTSIKFVDGFNKAGLDIGDNVLIARAGTQQKPVWTVSKVQKDF